MKRKERKAEVQRLLRELEAKREAYERCTNDTMPRYVVRWIGGTSLTITALVDAAVFVACILTMLTTPSSSTPDNIRYVIGIIWLVSFITLIIVGAFCCSRQVLSCWVDYTRWSMMELTNVLDKVEKALAQFDAEQKRFALVMERFERFSADLADLPVIIETHQKLGDFYVAVKLKNEKEG